MRASKIAEATFPTPHGNFRLFAFESCVGGPSDGRSKEAGAASVPSAGRTVGPTLNNEDKSDSALALVLGDPVAAEAPLVRIHSQCLTGDVFGSRRCDCGDQLEFAHQAIGQAGM